MLHRSFVSTMVEWKQQYVPIRMLFYVVQSDVYMSSKMACGGGTGYRGPRDLSHGAG
jgi:hypothetical protein